MSTPSIPLVTQSPRATGAPIFAFDPGSLVDTVHADPGAVTSRVLLRTQGSVLTVFAFAEGQGLTEHATPHDAVLLLLEGRLRISIGARELELEAGEIVHLPASVPHTLHEGEAFKMLLVLMKGGG